VKITEIRDLIIPALKTHIGGLPVIEADQTGKRPTGAHATYKFTSPYVKDIGQPEVTVVETAETYLLRQTETFKVTLSITAYHKDVDESIELAQKIRDWFDFYGQEDLEAAGIAVVSLGQVENRDALVVDDYERRNGFDVILRAHKTLQQGIEEVGYFDKVEINNKIYP